MSSRIGHHEKLCPTKLLCRYIFATQITFNRLSTQSIVNEAIGRV